MQLVYDLEMQLWSARVSSPLAWADSEEAPTSMLIYPIGSEKWAGLRFDELEQMAVWKAISMPFSKTEVSEKENESKEPCWILRDTVAPR